MTRQITGYDFGIDKFMGSRRRLADIGNMDVAARHAFGMAWQANYFKLHDFDEDTINLDYWLLTHDTNGTDYAITAGACGTIVGTAGNTDAEGIGINGPAIFKGDLNCGMEVRMKLNVVTNSIFEVGFGDASITSHKDPVGNDIDTPTVTNNATDAVLIHRHTGQTLTNAALLAVGSTPYAAQKTTTGWSPTADTFFSVRIQLKGDGAFCYIFDANQNFVAGTAISMPSAIEGGTLVHPFVNVTRVSTADKIATIDYIALWQDRV